MISLPSLDLISFQSLGLDFFGESYKPNSTSASAPSSISVALALAALPGRAWSSRPRFSFSVLALVSCGPCESRVPVTQHDELMPLVPLALAATCRCCARAGSFVRSAAALPTFQHDSLCLDPRAVFFLSFRSSLTEPAERLTLDAATYS